MRVLSWVQGKINGRAEKKTNEERYSGSACYHNPPEVGKEEYNNWPNELLTIGTLGNSGFIGDSQRYASSESSFWSQNPPKSSCSSQSLPKSSCSSQNLSNFTVEEIHKLQKELRRQLALKSISSSNESEIEPQRKSDLSLDRFLNCPSSLEIDQRTCQKFCDNLENGEGGDVSPKTRMLLIKAKDLLSEKHKKINQRSFSFLLKKMFVCGGGFVPAPSLRDPIPETRMEKLFRTIIRKKMYSQSSATTSMKYLEKKPMDEKGTEDEAQESTDSNYRWVKTDSEYIVLEI